MLDRYVGHLCREISIKADGAKIETVFLGGGTPTLLGPERIERLLLEIRRAGRISEEAEITVEANPESVNEDGLRRMLAAGINRISFGFQSFSERNLRKLGRIHSAEQASESAHAAHRAGFDNIGADLMFGLPDQALQEWEEDLHAALSLPLTHISCYELALEGEEPLARIKAQLPSEDLVADMWEMAMDRLPAAGFSHYEVANYAKPGFSCRHNLRYWLDLDFLGCGAGAWECQSGVRRANASDLAQYFAAGDLGYPPAIEDRPPPALKMSETLILNLRLRDGLREADFQDRYGPGSLESFLPALQPHISAGRVERSGGHMRLTRKGLLVANAVWTDLLKAGGEEGCGRGCASGKFAF